MCKVKYEIIKNKMFSHCAAFIFLPNIKIHGVFKVLDGLYIVMK